MQKITRVLLLLLTIPVLAAAAKTTITRKNLQKAYNREMGIKAQYEASAAKADAEGYAGVAGVFRAVAYSEGIHAANHAKALADLGGKAADTWKPVEAKTGARENLEEAIRSETNESAKIYPPFVAQAVKEGNTEAVMSLKGAMASEGGHARLFAKVLKMAADWKTKMVVLVCRTCGYTVDDPGIKICPFCTHPREEFAEM